MVSLSCLIKVVLVGSSYKEATHINVLYYKLHGLVSIMKIVKFYKPNQIMILLFLWHIDLYQLCTISS